MFLRNWRRFQRIERLCVNWYAIQPSVPPPADLLVRIALTIPARNISGRRLPKHDGLRNGGGQPIPGRNENQPKIIPGRNDRRRMGNRFLGGVKISRKVFLGGMLLLNDVV
jgi:hypothetical protein